jgi:hypothetical protein
MLRNKGGRREHVIPRHPFGLTFRGGTTAACSITYTLTKFLRSYQEWER